MNMSTARWYCPGYELSHRAGRAAATGQCRAQDLAAALPEAARFLVSGLQDGPAGGRDHGQRARVAMLGPVKLRLASRHTPRVPDVAVLQRIHRDAREASL
jgi:hypothetical protein